MLNIDEIDSAILNRIQSDFPITSRPFLSVAEELGLTEKEVLARVARLKSDGIIRRIRETGVCQYAVRRMCATRSN